MKKVLVVSCIKEETKKELREIEGYRFSFYDDFSKVSKKVLEDTEVFIGLPNQEEINKMPKLEWVQLVYAGANNYAWLPTHIVLSNATGGYGIGMSEYMLACILMIKRSLLTYYHQQLECNWNKLNDLKRLSESKVLSVGMGDIGTEFIKRCAFLGATCYGVRRTKHDKPDYVEELFTTEEMDRILPECDVVALSMPETNETKGLFDEERLRKLKKDAILINVGRGSAVVTKDLIKVMNEGHLLGACLDVMEEEPLPKDHPLWKTPRVYITPHISGGFETGANYNDVIKVIKENLIRMNKGEPLLHEVNRELGY